VVHDRRRDHEGGAAVALVASMERSWHGRMLPAVPGALAVSLAISLSRQAPIVESVDRPATVTILALSFRPQRRSAATAAGSSGTRSTPTERLDPEPSVNTIPRSGDTSR
jgi:hypothetical protein